MNRTTFHRIFILFLVMISLSGVRVYSRSNNDGEKVMLFTDRTLYIKGESILFAAYLLDDINISQSESSKVLYCELISPDGNKITLDKFLFIDGAVSGYLIIPTDITTGYYYLRAYTRYMRNEGPSAFHYTLLKIINPDNPAVVIGNKLDTVGPTFTALKTEDATQITTDKQKYSYRDTVIIHVSNVSSDQSSNTNYCLSVIPETSFQSVYPALTVNHSYIPDNQYFRENIGLSLTGNVSESKSGKPSVDTRINLVIIGKGRDFMAVNTDNKGRFFFALPNYKGFRDILLSADSKSRDSLKMQIDNDFYSIPARLPSPFFTLGEEERKVALQMTINAKLNEVFPGDTLEIPPYKQAFDNAFYGHPDEIVVLDKYVQLTSLEEYFNELTMNAKVRKSRGKPYFKVFGPQPELLKYEPLVLVDWVAIDDPARILAISPQNVARIEIVNQIYVKGEQSYGGIISIFSKHGDFAGIELPASSVFINYRFLAEDNPNDFIKYGLPHHPDTRNTLYWNPKLECNTDNTATVKIATSDCPGKYTIILRSVNSSGQIQIKTSTFEVSK